MSSVRPTAWPSRRASSRWHVPFRPRTRCCVVLHTAVCVCACAQRCACLHVRKCGCEWRGGWGIGFGVGVGSLEVGWLACATEAQRLPRVWQAVLRSLEAAMASATTFEISQSLDAVHHVRACVRVCTFCCARLTQRCGCVRAYAQHLHVCGVRDDAHGNGVIHRYRSRLSMSMRL